MYVYIYIYASNKIITYLENIIFYTAHMNYTFNVNPNTSCRSYHLELGCQPGRGAGSMSQPQSGSLLKSVAQAANRANTEVRDLDQRLQLG